MESDQTAHRFRTLEAAVWFCPFSGSVYDAFISFAHKILIGFREASALLLLCGKIASVTSKAIQ